VDIVLQAHDHNYQRTYPISYNRDESSYPFVTDSNVKNYKDPSGQVYFAVETGGSAIHKFSGKASFVSAQYMAFGFLDISLTSNGRNLTCSFYESSDDSMK
jgi:hypothetical protein